MARKPKKPKEEELPEDDDLLAEDEVPAVEEDETLPPDGDVELEEDQATADYLLDDDDAATAMEDAPAGDDDDASGAGLALDEETALEDEDLSGAGLALDEEPPLDEPADAPPDEDEPAAVDEEPEPEKIAPAVSLLTLLLCFLNLAALAGFLFLLTLDFNRRQAWSYYVFRNDLELWGLPLAEEEQMTTGFTVTRAASRIDPDVLKKEYEERKRKLFGPDFKGIGGDTFMPVNEVVGQRLTPEQLSPEALKEVFKDCGGEPVRTLQDEVDLVKKKLLPAIERAAAETAQNAKNEDEKRKKLDELLLPLAYTPHEIDRVHAKIHDKMKGVKADDLDRVVADAAQRRMLMDVLEPLQALRPRADEDRKVLESSADPEAPALENLKTVLNKRLDEAAARTEPGKAKVDSWARRSNIAFLLYTVGQLRKPDNQPLDARALARAEVVVGLHEYVRSAEDFALVLGKMQDRLTKAVRADREGWSFVNSAGRVDRIHQFVGEYEEQIRAILTKVAEIRNEETRLATLQKTRDDTKTNFEERKKDYDAMVEKLIASREETARLVVELRRLDRQLYEAQKELANAFERNQELERELRRLELPFVAARKKR